MNRVSIIRVGVSDLTTTICLKRRVFSFGKKIKGFDEYDTILVVVELRTSSPVHISRNDLSQSSIERMDS